MTTVGILGGGQLGKMLCEAARELGVKTVVLDPTEGCPASSVADETVVGSFADEESIRKLESKADLLTIEIEHVDAQTLKQLKEDGKTVHPDPETIAQIQDKFVQKTLLFEHNLPVASFLEVKSGEDARKAGRKFGYPFILKARTHAYDGRGNYVVRSEETIAQAMEFLSGKPLYAEKMVPFTKELAVQLARSADGDVAIYPVVETVHKDSICHTASSPAQITEEEAKKALEISKRTLEVLKGAGLFTIEMFLTEEGDILINEIAPRVHNSGHQTIEGCETSQFTQHLRAVTGMELGSTALKTKAATMINILGERDGASDPSGIEDAQALGEVFVHIYGKAQTKKARKMGHITVLGESVEDTLEIAERARRKVSI